MFPCNLLPVLVFEETSSNLRQRLNDESIISRDVGWILRYVELFEATEHIRQHGQLVKEDFVHELAESE